MPEHPYLQWPVFSRSIVAAFDRSLTSHATGRNRLLRDVDELVRHEGPDRFHVVLLIAILPAAA